MTWFNALQNSLMDFKHLESSPAIQYWSRVVEKQFTETLSFHKCKTAEQNVLYQGHLFNMLLNKTKMKAKILRNLMRCWEAKGTSKGLGLALMTTEKMAEPVSFSWVQNSSFQRTNVGLQNVCWGAGSKLVALHECMEIFCYLISILFLYISF